LVEKLKRSPLIKRRNLDWYLALFALLTILSAWWLGKKRINEQSTDLLRNYYPESVYKVQNLDHSVWRLTGKEKHFIISSGMGKGYAAPIKVIVQYDNSHIADVKILSSQETPSYFSKVIRKDFLDQFIQKKWDDVFIHPGNIDVVSGATKSCKGILKGVQKASLNLAKSQNLEPVPEIKETRWQIGFKEGLIVVIFLLGILSRLHNIRYKKYLKWITLLLGLIFLGFVFNEPITLTRINSFLMGFWPDWHTELYIYLLFLGVLLILLTSGRNIYCHTFCPFGALQELTGKLGKARNVKLKYRYFWIWFQRSLAWIAILLSLVMRNPGISEYEVFGAAFQLTGSVWLFLLLGIILVASFIIRKPWCNYFCPINPIFGFIQLFRRKIKSLWQKA
jgi:uncharacterized protein with FMN-binding domain